jgi:hypothetical protein
LLACVSLGCGGDDDGGGGMADARPNTMAPSITRVSWAPMGACAANVASSYTITVTTTDGDTAEGMLTIMGSLPSCTPGTWTMREQVVRCPNIQPYVGNMTVRDPEGNVDTQAFTVTVCGSGMAP